jgi:signal transduction histidine kinase
MRREALPLHVPGIGAGVRASGAFVTAAVAARIFGRVASAVALWFCLCALARAEVVAFDAAALKRSIELGNRFETLRDPGRALKLEDVTRGAAHLSFVPNGGVVTHGVDDAALWLRFAVVNSASTPRRIMLELGYPHLDDVVLYALHEGGPVDTVTTGDALPFASRPVAVANFVFPLEVRAGERLRVYVRCVTTSTLTVPLSAWESLAYVEHVRVQSVTQWLFCGAILMMALYNLAVFSLVRRAEYLTQSLQLICICCATVAFRGELFPLALPTWPELANKGIAFFLTLSLAASALTIGRVAASSLDTQWLVRSLDRAAVLAATVAVVVLFIPDAIVLRLNLGITLAYLTGGGALLVYFSVRPPREAKLYVCSWYFPAVGCGVTVLANLAVLPDHPILLNAAYAGVAVQALLTPLGLAARVKSINDHVGTLNVALSQNVLQLEQALEDARLANTLAQQAMHARDGFLATMSHELRTPLNAIINVPQGLLEDFKDEPIASCTCCHTQFVLDPGETVHDGTACLECGKAGTLQPGKRVTYKGEPARTARFLSKVERAGHHLLELVDSVLDFSKMEAGRVKLSREPADLITVIREAAEAMSAAASQRGIDISVSVPQTPLLRSFDRVRIRQVLLNLLSNAIKFTDDGGRVGIELASDDAHDADLIYVTDSGIGIAPEDHERIFVGFEQVHRKKNQRYGGTGLGLPISRNLIRLHGGELRVESALERGTRFVIQLPRTVPAAATEDAAAPTASTTVVTQGAPARHAAG